MWTETYIGLRVKYSVFWSDFNGLDFSGQILEKYSDNKFHENPSSASRVAPCGQTDMTKLTVAFRNFANSPKTQPVNAIQGNSGCLFSDPHKAHKYAV
jgi:hypothetical protein